MIMPNVIVNINFPSDNLESRMMVTAEQIAAVLAYHHTCGADCEQRPELHIRINDDNTGKGIDQFYMLRNSS